METKVIIICGILIVAVFLLGLFRLWWLRKCYDKARTEKRDVLPSEQMALADKLLKTYSKARSTTWKSMGIALAVIAILGTAVWGFNRIAQTTKAEKEQAKVEEREEGSGKGLFYYFSYDANLERFIENRKEKLEKAQAEYQEAAQNLTKAKQSGDLTQITKCNIKLKKLKEELVWAQTDYNNLEGFDFRLNLHYFGFGLLSIVIVFLLLSFVDIESTDNTSIEFNVFCLFWISVFSVVALVCARFVSFVSVICFLLLICNIWFFIKNRERIAEALCS